MKLEQSIKIRKIGNSVGLYIPSAMLKAMDFEIGNFHNAVYENGVLKIVIKEELHNKANKTKKIYGR